MLQSPTPRFSADPSRAGNSKSVGFGAELIARTTFLQTNVEILAVD